jgi:uncharacterized repeat protein (TIGR03803 family)
MSYLPARSLGRFCTFLAIVTVSLASNGSGQEKVLYSFTGTTDGDAPQAGLVADLTGNLYGVSQGGNEQLLQCQASNGCGMVYELVRSPSGSWTETVLHTFIGGSDGLRPLGKLVFDQAGNLYGTTSEGGTGCGGLYGCGTVYELSPNGDGTWAEKILYNFEAGSDAEDPEAGVIFDNAGNLYGTARFGVNSACNTLGCGAVFELTPGAGDTWSEQVLYTFQDGTDGAEPGASLIFDQAGNLYGTAGIGGDVACNPPYGCGTIYKLSPGTGGWTETVLHTFECGLDGCFPNNALTIDSAGNLAGTMVTGGASGHGYVYRLSLQTGGSYRFNAMHSFDLDHGGGPSGTLLLAGGSLYGTTSYGGNSNRLCSDGCGGVFRLTPGGAGINYTFLGFGTSSKGAAPFDGLIFGLNHRLYGSTSAGGANNAGSVFAVVSDFN